MPVYISVCMMYDKIKNFNPIFTYIMEIAKFIVNRAQLKFT